MTFMLLLHIAAACSSIAVATWALFSPSKTKLKFGYSLTAGTVATGTYLIVAAPTHMLEVCTVGLVYLAAVGTALVAARHKLARQTSI